MISKKFFFKLLENSKFGTLHLHLPNGSKETFGTGNPEFNVKVYDEGVFNKIIRKGDIGFGEAIINKSIEIDDEAGLIKWVCLNSDALENFFYGKWYGNLIYMFRHRLNSNRVNQAKKNILAHYDLGNDFYKTWLDQTMTYSSALYYDESSFDNGLSLEKAQLQKYDRIIDKLNIKSHDHVLEIGCGWGGFFTRLVEKTGCKVTAILNSDAQGKFCQKRIDNNGMQNFVDLKVQDYRDIDGKFDKVVSIEMIEAVGKEYWDTYFQKVYSSLKPKGEAMIQAITLKDERFEAYTNSTDFIQQYVFPGGMLLSNNTIKKLSSKCDLALDHFHEFGLSYGHTLKEWRKKFSNVKSELPPLGFDEKFYRLWHFYLAYCEGAFNAKHINVGQFKLVR